MRASLTCAYLNRSAPRLRPGGLQRIEEHTMRILVAGATGAVGQYLVPALIAAGHSVIGTTRSATKKEVVRRLGAEPVVADGLDAAGMRAAVIAAKPEIVIHQMT